VKRRIYWELFIGYLVVYDSLMLYMQIMIAKKKFDE